MKFLHGLKCPEKQSDAAPGASQRGALVTIERTDAEGYPTFNWIDRTIATARLRLPPCQHRSASRLGHQARIKPVTETESSFCAICWTRPPRKDTEG